MPAPVGAPPEPAFGIAGGMAMPLIPPLPDAPPVPVGTGIMPASAPPLPAFAPPVPLMLPLPPEPAAPLAPESPAPELPPEPFAPIGHAMSTASSPRINGYDIPVRESVIGMPVF